MQSLMKLSLLSRSFLLVLSSSAVLLVMPLFLIIVVWKAVPSILMSLTIRKTSAKYSSTILVLHQIQSTGLFLPLISELDVGLLMMSYHFLLPHPFLLGEPSFLALLFAELMMTLFSRLMTFQALLKSVCPFSPSLLPFAMTSWIRYPVRTSSLRHTSSGTWTNSDSSPVLLQKQGKMHHVTPKSVFLP